MKNNRKMKLGCQLCQFSKFMFLFVIVFILIACSSKPARTGTSTSAQATISPSKDISHSEDTAYPTMEFTPLIEATLAQTLEPLHKDFGLESYQIYKVLGYDVDALMQCIPEKLSNYPYDYTVYTSNEQVGSYSSERSVNKGMILDKIQEYMGGDGPLIIREEHVFESVMGSGFFSDLSVKDRHQMIVLVTEEEGEDGVIRNAFYSYSSSGIVVFVDENFNNRTLVWEGDNIDTKDLQIRSLVEEGYSNIRKKGGKYFAIGKKVGDLPQRNNISLGN